MNVDIVFVAEDNETAFINRARRLGYSGLCFLYEEKSNPSTKLSALQSKLTSFTLYSGIMGKKVKTKSNSDFVFSTTATRKLVQTGFTALFDVEESSDGMHQRRSGLNQVICKEMHLHHVAYGINVNKAIAHPQRSQHLGRIMQNIVLCEKYQVPILVGSFAKRPLEMRNCEDVISLLRILGINDARGCVTYLSSLLKK